jgi:alkylhydroperoxidase family enzyme
MARAFGVDADVLAAMLDDVDAAPLEPAMRPLLAYVRQLTLAPAKMTQTLTNAALEAGWSEDALFEAASVCALYNYMNRIVEAVGIVPGEEYAAPDAEALKLRRSSTYVGWGERSGLLPLKP